MSPNQRANSYQAALPLGCLHGIFNQCARCSSSTTNYLPEKLWSGHFSRLGKNSILSKLQTAPTSYKLSLNTTLTSSCSTSICSQLTVIKQLKKFVLITATEICPLSSSHPISAQKSASISTTSISKITSPNRSFHLPTSQTFSSPC